MTRQADRIQNAINHIKSATDVDPWAVDLAVEALEKQIPQEPVYVAEDRYVKNMYAMFPQCPSCGHEIAPGDVFCLMCGQAIDRRKEDDHSGSNQRHPKQYTASCGRQITAYGNRGIESAETQT